MGNMENIVMPDGHARTPHPPAGNLKISAVADSCIQRFTAHQAVGLQGASSIFDTYNRQKIAPPTAML